MDCVDAVCHFLSSSGKWRKIESVVVGNMNLITAHDHVLQKDYLIIPIYSRQRVSFDSITRLIKEKGDSRILQTHTLAVAILGKDASVLLYAMNPGIESNI
eukprot:TRINITY_DN12527_c0_g1_i1.p1 TRINITY_DN12527_c0_g1~~TRINITY_DN12527_c0_g1_i1.p1  ORF type:complete len:101 (+),score=23.72 TRINITY_DN12527_c0_g1_i1:100-402(+)